MPATDTAPGTIVGQGQSVRGLLMVFTAALALPIVCFAAFLFWRVAENERSRLEGDASDLARSAALAIDREMTGLMASLDVLSLSIALQSADFPAFYRQAEGIAARQGLVPVLADMSRQELVNLRLPLGQPLGRSNLPVTDQNIASGRPFVTDLFESATTHEQVVAVGTTVFRDGRPAYLLYFSLGVDRFRRILSEADVPETWIASVIDRRDRVIARSARHHDFIGRTATRDLQENTNGREGTWAGTSLDGIPIFGAYARSRVADYRVAVGVKYADLNAPLWRSLSLFAALGLVIACLSSVLAVYFGQRIARPLMALSEGASALGRGDPVRLRPTGLREANEVGAAMTAGGGGVRARQADLKEANEESQRFAYIVSHDLRSPLVNIMGFTTELETLRDDVFQRLHAVRHSAGPGLPPPSGRPVIADEDEELASDFEEALGFIKTSISKMDRLINAILSLSREGRRAFKPERIDMDVLVKSIADNLAHQASAAGAEIVAGKLPSLTSDRLALEQIFGNLIDNALKYLRTGVPGRVEIEGRATAAGLVYEVRDNGRGIDPKDRERVFELFRRSGVQDRPGEGIGLAHVRSLARRLGGAIAFTSELGKGSTFVVTLPRRWSAETKKDAA